MFSNVFLLNLHIGFKEMTPKLILRQSYRLYISDLKRSGTGTLINIVEWLLSFYRDLKCYHQEVMSMKSIPPRTSLLYSKTGVYRGIPTFLIFVPKHRFLVLVRTVRTVYPQSMF